LQCSSIPSRRKDPMDGMYDRIKNPGIHYLK
jgi:hypothetical protein